VSLRVSSVLFTIIISVCAFGQQYQKLRDRDPDLAGSKKILEDIQQANIHYGSWYLMSRIRIADLGFSDTGYVPTGDQSGGISLSVEAPNRLYYRPRQKVIFTAEVIPGYSFFGDRGTNQFNYSTRGDVHFLFNHLYLDAYVSRLDQLRAHVSDINRLATVRETVGGLAGEIKYSSRTSVLFNVDYTQTNYPNGRYQPRLPNGSLLGINLLDRNQRDARVSLAHKTFPKTTVFLSAEASNYAFRRATYKDSMRVFAGGGLAWNSGRTQVRFEAGKVRLNFDDPAQRDYRGVSGQFTFGRTNGPWGFDGGVDRDLGFSITANNNYFISTVAHAGLSYQATRRLTLRTNAVRERDDFDEPVLGTDRVDNISFYSVGFTYGLQRLRFGSDVGWYERDSTIFEEKDNGIRYLVHLSFTP
jgi:hypothetical protein